VIRELYAAGEVAIPGSASSAATAAAPPSAASAVRSAGGSKRSSMKNAKEMARAVLLPQPIIIGMD